MIPMRRIVVAAGCALLLGACLPGISRTTGRPIGDDGVDSIAPGTTTKSALFERFGPPAAIVARHEVAVVSTALVRSDPFRGGQPSYSFDADTFFELFPSAMKSGEYRRIYYYRRVESDGGIFYMLLAIYQTGKTKADGLWVLVNEKTGIVDDYAFRRYGGITRFGLPRAAPPR